MAVTGSSSDRARGRPGRPRADGPVAGDDLRAGHRLARGVVARPRRLAGELRALGSGPDAELHRPSRSRPRTTARSVSATSSRRSRTRSRRGRSTSGWPRGRRARAGGRDLPPDGHQAPARSRDHRGGARRRRRSSWRSLILWFRSATPGLFAKHFLNFADLEGYGGAFVRGATNTLILAFAGEIGGIVIGLVLGDPHALAAASGAGPGADLHQLLPRDAADLAAGHRVLRAALRVRDPSVGVRRRDHRVRAEHRRVRGRGVPRRDPVDRTRADGGRPFARA